MCYNSAVERDDPPQFEPGRVPSQRPGKQGSVRERNRIDRTQRICEAALDLFLARGLGVITIDEITRDAGVAKGSFYRYFHDKEQLVTSLFAPLAEQLLGAMDRCEQALGNTAPEPGVYGAYATLAMELSALLLGSPRLVRLYLQQCRGPADGPHRPIRALSDKVAERAIGLTVTANRLGLLRDLPPTVTALAVVGATEALLARFLDGEATLEPAEATRALVTMVLDGMRP